MVLTSNKNIAFSITFKSNITLIYIYIRKVSSINWTLWLFIWNRGTNCTYYRCRTGKAIRMCNAYFRSQASLL